MKSKSRTELLRIALLASCLAIGACYDGVEADEQGESSSEESEGTGETAGEDPFVELEGTLDASSICVELQPGEHLVSLGPEGHAWLSPVAGASANYRVIGPDGAQQALELEHETELLQAWDASRVNYMAEGQLWLAELDDSLTEPLFWPDTLEEPSYFCGDPTLDGDGFVVAGDTLVQRDAGLWWRWLTPAGEDYGPVAAFGSSYGACVDRSGAAWMRTPTGQVWRLSAAEVLIIEALADAQSLVFDESFGVAALIDGQLTYGNFNEGWTSAQIEDPAGTPAAGESLALASVTALAASAGRLWVSSSRGLLTFDGERWDSVSISGELVVDALEPAQLWADAEAAWILRGSELCRLDTGSGIVLDGLRPLQRVVESLLSFELFAPAAGPLEIMLDGELVFSHGGSDFSVPIDNLELGDPGWHDIEILGAQGIARHVALELRLPTVGTWIDDIKPLAETHCTAIGGCHGPEVDGTGRPVLSTYEGWVLSSNAIRARIGLTGDMPPLASRLPSWDAGEVSMILTWLEAGMPKGE